MSLVIATGLDFVVKGGARISSMGKNGLSILVIRLPDNPVKRDSRLWSNYWIEYVCEIEKRASRSHFVFIKKDRVSSGPTILRSIVENLFALGNAIVVTIKGRKYDCVVSYHEKVSVWIGLLRKVYKRQLPKHILLEYTADLSEYSGLGRIKGFFLAACLKSLDAICVCSDYERELYSLAFGLPIEKLHFIPSSVDSSIFGESVEDGDYIFSGGDSYRDYETLIEAVKETSIKTIIVGDIPNSYKNSLSPNIRSIPKVARDEFYQLMAGSKFVVIPLKNAKRCVGNVVLFHSMAMGKSTIISDIPTVNCVENNKNALLVAPSDPKRLRDAITTLECDEEKRKQFGRQAKLFAAQHLATPIIISEVFKLIHSIIGRSQVAPHA